MMQHKQAMSETFDQSSEMRANVSMLRIPGLDLVSMDDFEAECDARRVPVAPEDETPKGHHVAMLNKLCQSYACKAEYTYSSSGPNLFTGTIKIVRGDQELESFTTEASYRSKKAVKESLAQAGMVFVTAQAPIQPEPALTVSSTSLSLAVVDRSERYADLLYGHTSANRQPNPEYSEYTLGPYFGCTVVLPGYPDKAFDTGESAYATKKDARHMAAREAVYDLRNEGAMRLPIACLDSKDLSALETNESQTNNKSEAGMLLETMPVARVISLCHALKLQAPQYRWTHDHRVPGLVSGGAVFDDQIKMPGIFGEVQQIFGQKKAREECAKKVVAVLEIIVREGRGALTMMDSQSLKTQSH